MTENGEPEDEDLKAMQEIVNKACEAFGENSMYVVGQALTALLGMYFHKLETDDRRLVVGNLILDGAVKACRGMQEQDANRPTIN